MTRPSPELSQMLETAIAAARLAGQHAKEQLRCIRRTVKNGNEIVTQADSACQTIIIDHIRQQYPEHGVIAEEGPDGKLLHCPPRTGTSVWWVIDPIDGTNNYASGLFLFCVSIAVMVEGKPVLGVIFDPMTDSMYTAAEGTDAMMNGSSVTVSEDDINQFASFAVDSHLNPETNNGVREMMRQTRFRSLGSTALHLACVAKGAMIGMAAVSSKLWDIAAGAIIIQQAGGIVSDFHGNPIFPVSLRDYNAEYFGILATNQKIYNHTLELFTEK